MASSAKAYRVLSCLKLFLTIFTVFFLCTGVLFLATGIYGLIALNYFFNLSPEVNLSLTPAILCGIGGIVIFSGLFGFLSAFKDNKCLINCYCLLLAFVFLAEVCGGIMALIFMKEIENSFKTGFSTAMKNYNPRESNYIDQAQSELQCCGVSSYEDWFYTAWANETRLCDGSNVVVPLTCCKSVYEQGKNDSRTTLAPSNRACYCGNTDEEGFINAEGCLRVLFGSNGQTLHYLLAATFAVAATQLFGIILALCIYCKLRQISSSRRYY